MEAVYAFIQQLLLCLYRGWGFAMTGWDATVHCRLKITKRTQLQMWTSGTEMSGFQKAHLQNHSGLGTSRTEVEVASVCHLDTKARRENTGTVCWQSKMHLVYHPSVDAEESIKDMKSTGRKARPQAPLVGGKIEEAVVWQYVPNVTKMILHYVHIHLTW